MEKEREKEIRRLFRVTLFLKGAHAMIELLGGLFLYLASADLIPSYLFAAMQGLGGTSRSFAALYLLSHGIVNGFVVLGLWKEKLWAYPVSFVVIGAFTGYQFYLLAFGFSWWLLGLTVLDLAILFLAWHEYKVLRKSVAR